VINALEIRNIIIEYAKRGTSVLVSSHNMLEIEYLSNEVGIIDQGEIIETGTVSELKKKHDAKNLEEVFLRLKNK
jgi:ABC-2 type transport system ATP-binding protein